MPEYPYPDDEFGVPNGINPTYCGVDLGAAAFVTRGTAAGEFFAAHGTLNQITVVDTRDDDVGWILTGVVADFVANSGTDAFSGSQLGWRPVVTDDTDAFTDSSGTRYDQVVSAGAVVPPNARQIEGLSNGGTLARSTAGHGLGTAIVDARVKLLIPVTADAGVYETTVTITAI